MQKILVSNTSAATIIDCVLLFFIRKHTIYKPKMHILDLS